MKCDEQLPVCQNCINSKRKCYRGIRLNFTQYTIYDPKENAVHLDPLPPGRMHRILDQSITVSNIYKNGADRYRPYMHLHSQDDLKDADRLLHQDLNEDFPIGQQPAVGPLPQGFLAYPAMPYQGSWPMDASSTLGLTDNVILENCDIKSVLMNPVLDFADPAFLFPMAEANAVSSRKHSWPDPGEIETEYHTLSLDAQPFVLLLQNQKYYWLLDLFNGLDLWKSMVPSYCVRLVQSTTEDRHDKYFLWRCLLACDQRATPETVLKCAHDQLAEWAEFDTKDVTSTLFRNFESVLISVVLLLLATLLQVSRPGFNLDGQWTMILANQGRLFHKLVGRYERISEAKFKRIPCSVLTVASFQAVAVLRFFLKMHLRYFGETRVTFHNPLDIPLVYDERNNYSLVDLFTISEFELGYLATGYANFDISLDGGLPSDAGKLRNAFWALLRMEHLRSEPLQPLLMGGEGTTVLIPNDKCTALNIVASYAHKVEPAPTRDAADKVLHEIFAKINLSTQPQDIKEKWATLFRWAIDTP